MEYKIYRFIFKSGVHFGKKSLEDAEYTIGADTIFSAMCHEYLKQGVGSLEHFVELAVQDRVKISDAFPYIGDTYYLPKPMLRINDDRNQGDSTLKKAYKKLTYVPADLIDVYLAGNIDVRAESNNFRQNLGRHVMMVNASVRGEEETLPYRVGSFYFSEQSGLYIVVGYENEEILSSVEACLTALGMSGIGGKRNSGLGRFKAVGVEVPEALSRRLAGGNAKVYMTLSGTLPKDDEMEEALENASYLLTKRSGFVASDNYAREQQRKRDLYIMQSGSCFERKFTGDIADVGNGGSHAVYRYAKPLFMEVVS